MASTGSINIVLTAQSNAFNATVEKVSGGLKGLADHSESIGERLKGSFENLPSLLSGGGIEAGIQGLSGGLSSVAGSAAKALGALGPVGLAIGGVVVVAAAAAAAVVGLGFAIKSMVEPALEAIDVNGKLADRLGIAQEKLIGLQHAGNLAGVDIAGMTGALEKMLKSLGAGDEETGKAAEAFAKLGLNAQDLKNQDTGQTFTDIAQKISEIKNPTERAEAAMAIFGKTGQSLLPLMMSGAEGIRAAQEEAVKLGLSYSRIDSAKVEAANDAMTRVGEGISGIGTQMAVVLSPAIQAVSEALLDWLPSADTVRDAMRTMITIAVNGVGLVINAYEMWKRGNLVLADGFFALNNTVTQTFLKIGQSIIDVINLIPGVKVEMPESLKKAGEDAARLAADAHAAAQAAWDKPLFDGNKWINDAENASQKGAEAVAENAKFMKAQENAEKAAAKINDSLSKVGQELDVQKLIASPEGAKLKAGGLTDEDIRKMQELKAGGATEEQALAFANMAEQINRMKEAAKQAQAQLENTDKVKQKLADLRAEIEGMASGLSKDQLDIKKLGGSDADVAAAGALEKQKKLREELNKQVEESKTAQDKYNDAIDMANEGLRQGIITQEQFDRLKDKADQDLEKADKKDGKGDKKKSEKEPELKAEERRFAFTAFENPTQDQSLKVQQDQLRQQTELVRYGRETRDFIKEMRDGGDGGTDILG